MVGIRENPNNQEMKMLIKIVGNFSWWCLYNVLKGETRVHEVLACKQLLLPLCPVPHLLSSLETFVISFSNQHMIWGNWTFHGWNREEKGTRYWQTKHISIGTDIITSMHTGQLSYESTHCQLVTLSANFANVIRWLRNAEKTRILGAHLLTSVQMQFQFCKGTQHRT